MFPLKYGHFEGISADQALGLHRCQDPEGHWNKRPHHRFIVQRRQQRLQEARGLRQRKKSAGRRHEQSPKNMQIFQKKLEKPMNL